MSKGFDGRRYIPTSILSQVTSQEMIHEILREDPLPDATHSQQEEFTKCVLERGRKLLAMVVSASLNISCLRRILDQGHSDQGLLQRPLTDDDLCHKDYCDPSFGYLVQIQGGFSAARFLEKGQHQDLHKSTVIPIHYCSSDADQSLGEATKSRSEAGQRCQQEGEKEKKDSYCGSGAYSSVYRVKIDPAHHSLSEVSHKP